MFGNSGQPASYLAHIEQTANNNPSSSSAQYAFYSACMRAGRPDIVISRHESARYASNQQCENLYHQALDRLGVRRNDAQTPANQNQAAGANASYGLSADQRQALGQAVAARAHGSNAAINTRGGSGGKESPLYVVVEESYGALIFRWVKLFVATAVFLYFFWVALALFMESSAPGAPRKGGNPKDAQARAEIQHQRFSDVHGCDEAKEELQELVDFLKAPDKFSRLGGKLPKGVLLIGPPGTGKTLLARAVAGEAGVPFFYMSGSEFDEVYVGVGARRVRELFNAARAKAPSIVFIDELDAIGARRNDRDATYVKQTLNQLLTELDGFEQSSGVIFMAATNFPKLLDKALTRPGRFDRQVHVPIPDVRGRVAILKHHMRNIQLNPDVDAAVLARGTPGCSGAELENIVNQAAVRASKNKEKNVSMLDFEWAKDRIMMGAERRSAILQEKDKLMTAYHEGGHALVAMFSRNATPLYKATIMPRGHALGLTTFLPDMDKVNQSKKELLATIDICMGGKVAEEMIYGLDGVTSGASSDLQKATQLAYQMVTQMGFSENLGDTHFWSIYRDLSPQTKEKIDEEVRKIIEDSKKRTHTLLTEKRKELDLLASGLLEYETLTKAEMEQVVKGEKLPEKKIHAERAAPMKIPEVPLPPIGIPKPPPPEESDRPGAVPGGAGQ